MELMASTVTDATCVAARYDIVDRSFICVEAGCNNLLVKPMMSSEAFRTFARDTTEHIRDRDVSSILEPTIFIQSGALLLVNEHAACSVCKMYIYQYITGVCILLKLYFLLFYYLIMYSQTH